MHTVVLLVVCCADAVFVTLDKVVVLTSLRVLFAFFNSKLTVQTLMHMV